MGVMYAPSAVSLPASSSRAAADRDEQQVDLPEIDRAEIDRDLLALLDLTGGHCIPLPSPHHPYGWCTIAPRGASGCEPGPIVGLPRRACGHLTGTHPPRRREEAR